jgi:hypothetical protein
VSGRPRLNVGASPSPAVVTAPLIADPSGPESPATTEWNRPPTSNEPTVAVPSAAGEQLRRSGAPKRNHTVSVPADLATAIRQRANTEGWSITDLVFLAVERYRARLVAAPELPGRAIGPRRAIARAHMVLYLADDEWTTWQDSARTGGLRTASRLVSEALASFV